MKTLATSLLGAAILVASPAAAETVLNTSLQNLNGTTYSTTTDATGTRTTSSGARVSGSSTPAGNWYQENVGGGGTVGITTDYARSGNGSAYFATTNSNSKADLSYNLGQLVSLSSFSNIAYDFYRDPASTAGAGFAPVFRMAIFKETNGAVSYAGLLVNEFLYQNQTNPPAGNWTTVTSTQTNGIWWATNAALGPTFASANGGQKSLADWISGNAGSTLYVGGYNMGVGSGWSGTFAGAIDNVNITNATGARSFNFEVAAATGAVPEPSTWLLLIAGFGLTGAAMRRRRTALAFA